MRLLPFIMLMLAESHAFSTGTAAISPKSVVRELYQQVVARRPLGIPKGTDKAAIAPFLSMGLTRKLDAAQACQDDYFRQHSDRKSKPAFSWLEIGLFTGANEKGIPNEALVEREEKQQDGSFLVYVRLTYRESYETYERPPDPENKFSWLVAAVVVLQDGRPVVDDVVFFKDDSTKINSRLRDSFPGCNGSHWVGHKL